MSSRRNLTWDWPQDPSVADIATVLGCTYTPEGVAVWLYGHREEMGSAPERCTLYAQAVALAEGVFS